MKKILAALSALLLLALPAADKIAVAEPVNLGGISAGEIRLLWGMLEASAGGGQYELVTRGAMQSMLTEIGLVENSVLTDLSSTQKAKLGALKTVKYILVSQLGRFGSRYNLTLMLLDASTGEIPPERRTAETVDSLNELSNKLPGILRSIGLGPAVRSYGRSAVLVPAVRCANVPAFVPEELLTALEDFLLNKGMKLQNLNSVSAILSKNGIGDLRAAEPAVYARVGQLLQLDQLLQINITRFELRKKRVYIAVTRREGEQYIGDFCGNLRVISAQTGDLIRSAPFAVKIDFNAVNLDTSTWSDEDYARCLLQSGLPAIYESLIKGQK